LELGIAKRVVEVDDEQQLEQVLFVGAYLSVATCQNDYRHIHEEVPDEIHEERDLNLLQEGDVLLRQLVGLGEVQDHIPEIMRVDQVGIVEAVLREFYEKLESLKHPPAKAFPKCPIYQNRSGN